MWKYFTVSNLSLRTHKTSKTRSSKNIAEIAFIPVAGIAIIPKYAKYYRAVWQIPQFLLCPEHSKYIEKVSVSIPFCRDLNISLLQAGMSLLASHLKLTGSHDNVLAHAGAQDHVLAQGLLALPSDSSSTQLLAWR